MIVKALMENRGKSDEYLTEHGLSLYIEAGGRRILFDTGETGKFLLNAEKMGVDLSQVDLVIISHGHYDHAGGLAEFLKINSKAKVYMQSDAFIPHASDKEGELKDAGIDQGLMENDRVIRVDEDIFFDDDLVLFSRIGGDRLIPSGNAHLLMKKNDEWHMDNFHHEQNLIIKEGKKRVLVSGCSHRGIVNILEQATEHLDIPLTHVIGGFHLYDLKLEESGDADFLGKIALELEKYDAKLFTAHCTGYDQFLWLKERLGDRIDYLSAGTVLEI
jgi:7,8-dihydropterin-6-yl-methyl-4-(beta-D-ribofuranosyl)aminobenzene 5'-phosphate synthase